MKSSKNSYFLYLCLLMHTAFLLFIAPVIFLSFLNIFKQEQSENNKNTAAIVTKSFVFLEIINEERTKTCIDESCSNSTNNETVYSASAVVIDKDKVLTAGHVCNAYNEANNNLKKDPDIAEYENMSIKSQAVMWIIATDSNRNRLSARIFKIDNKSDLCILEVPGISDKLSIKISKSSPEKGDHVFTASAPLGIFSKNMTLIFDGLYAGPLGNSDIYTIPCRHGSSGAPIVNEAGELIGITYAASESIENVNIATNLDKIKEFLLLD